MSSRSSLGLIHLAPASVVLATFCAAGFVLEKYNGTHPEITMVTIAGLVTLALWTTRSNDARSSPPCSRLGWWTATVLSLVASAFFIWSFGGKYYPDPNLPPGNDIGQTTDRATREFWLEGTNPYARTDLNPRPELPQQFRGFHYGPGMLLAYFPASLASPQGYRWATVGWALILAISAVLLTTRSGSRGWRDITVAGLFCLACILSWEIVFRELGKMGVNDAAPLSLLLLSLYMASKGKWNLAGLLMGFSFACKFSPALFAMLALVRSSTPIKFWLSLMAAASVLVPFVLANPEAAVNNIFLSRLAVSASPTSLHHVIPSELHLAIKAFFPIVALVVVFRNFSQPFTPPSVLRSFIVIMAAGMLSHKEIHTNHLVWLGVVAACLLTEGRFCVVKNFQRTPLALRKK